MSPSNISLLSSKPFPGKRALRKIGRMYCIHFRLQCTKSIDVDIDILVLNSYQYYVFIPRVIYAGLEHFPFIKIMYISCYKMSLALCVYVV